MKEAKDTEKGIIAKIVRLLGQLVFYIGIVIAIIMLAVMIAEGGIK